MSDIISKALIKNKKDANAKETSLCVKINIDSVSDDGKPQKVSVTGLMEEDPFEKVTAPLVKKVFYGSEINKSDADSVARVVQQLSEDVKQSNVVQNTLKYLINDANRYSPQVVSNTLQKYVTLQSLRDLSELTRQDKLPSIDAMNKILESIESDSKNNSYTNFSYDDYKKILVDLLNSKNPNDSGDKDTIKNKWNTIIQDQASGNELDDNKISFIQNKQIYQGGRRKTHRRNKHSRRKQTRKRQTRRRK